MANEIEDRGALGAVAARGATVPAAASDMPCWYAEPSRQPHMSRCPSACNGPVSHAERLADGVQRFYCSDHAFWRAYEVGKEHVRALVPDERA